MSKGYIAKRLLMAVIILFIVIILNFVLPRLAPGDPLEQYYPFGATEEEKAGIREQYGYTGDIGRDLQIYLGQLVRFDFGYSFIYGVPVVQKVGEKLPFTLVLSLTCLLINATCGIAYGAYAATKRGKGPDKVLMGAASVTTALPAFWIAMMLLFLFAHQWGLFPSGQSLSDSRYGWEWNFAYIGDLLYHMALPIFTSAIGGIVGYSMTTRNAMIAVTNEDYIMTAKAKGLSSSDVLYKHTLRNALLPLVTSIGMALSGLIGGAVVVEKIFSWDGMGTLFADANARKDFPLMQFIMLLMSSITIVANLLVDFLYSALDPRIKLSR